MREVEIKARVSEHHIVREKIESFAGEGRNVNKVDFYFHKPKTKESAFRLRDNNGVLEITAKKKSSDAKGENNLEFEFTSDINQFDKAVDFFLCLGYEKYYKKSKCGWDWKIGNAHVELLEVNELGYFLEIEELLDFDADDEAVAKAQNHVNQLLLDFGCKQEDVCSQSYKSMILGEN